MAQNVGGKRKFGQPKKGGFAGAKSGHKSKQPRLDSKSRGGKQPETAGVLETKTKGKQSKRAALADAYEAEDSDPDEIKNSKRYDVSAKHIPGLVLCCLLHSCWLVQIMTRALGASNIMGI